MSFSLATAGLFRANPFANLENALRLVDPTTPGTPGTDSATIDVSGASAITGINYTGKDGESQFIQFFREAQLTQKRTPFTLAAASSAKDIQDAIHDILLLHEVDTIISVEKAGNNLTIEHTGAGTLESIVVDGTDRSLTRVAVQGVSVATPDVPQTTETASEEE